MDTDSLNKSQSEPGTAETYREKVADQYRTDPPVTPNSDNSSLLKAIQDMSQRYEDNQQELIKRLGDAERRLEETRRGAGTSPPAAPMVGPQYSSENIVISIEDTVRAVVDGLLLFAHDYSQGNHRQAGHSLVQELERLFVKRPKVVELVAPVVVAEPAVARW